MYVLSRAIGHKMSFRRGDSEDGAAPKALSKDKARTMGSIREDRRRQLLGKFAVGRRRNRRKSAEAESLAALSAGDSVSGASRLVEDEEGEDAEDAGSAAARATGAAGGAAAEDSLTLDAASRSGSDEHLAKRKTSRMRSLLKLLPGRRSRSPSAAKVRGDGGPGAADMRANSEERSEEAQDAGELLSVGAFLSSSADGAEKRSSSRSSVPTERVQRTLSGDDVAGADEPSIRRTASDRGRQFTPIEAEDRDRDRDDDGDGSGGSGGNTDDVTEASVELADGASRVGRSASPDSSGSRSRYFGDYV